MWSCVSREAISYSRCEWSLVCGQLFLTRSLNSSKLHDHDGSQHIQKPLKAAAQKPGMQLSVGLQGASQMCQLLCFFCIGHSLTLAALWTNEQFDGIPLMVC